MSSSVRNYNSVSTTKHVGPAGTTLSAAATSLVLASGETTDDFPVPPFTLVLEPYVSGQEEIVTVTAKVGSNTLTIVRGQEGTTGKSHIAGTEVRHMATGRDFQDSRDHIDSTTAHDATGGVVGATKVQTLTNKTLTAPAVNSPVINAGDTLTTTSTELNRVAGVTSAIQTQLDGKLGTTATAADSTKINGRTLYVQTTTPTSPVNGDIWLQLP